MNKPNPTDLEIFEKLFRPERPRKMGDKLEYRVRDLDAARSLADSIIHNKKLNLETAVIGNMSTMRAFFVQPKTA